MNELTIQQNIEHKIFTIRGVQVMIDRDLAELYGVETRALKQAVKRNIGRFPPDFMFELDDMEIESMVSQSVIPSKKHLGGAKPYAFTEQGVASLSGVLNSQTAIDINISILRAFVKMRKFLMDNADVFKRLELVEKQQVSYEIKTDEKFEILFNAIESKSIAPKQGVFFDGQIFDAYILISDLLKKAKNSIILIDNYCDESTLTHLSKADAKVKITLLTKTIAKQLSLDIQKYNAQYGNLKALEFASSHDRFLIIDQKEIYHIGASLKDLGKKWFAFSLLEVESFGLMERVRKAVSDE